MNCASTIFKENLSSGLDTGDVPPFETTAGGVGTVSCMLSSLRDGTVSYLGTAAFFPVQPIVHLPGGSC